MVDLEILRQFIAFGKYEKISLVAEEFHLSSPSVSRNMKKLEEDLGVELFDRKANSISLNKTGKFAVSEAKKILTSVKDSLDNIKSFDRSLKTISVGSVAPLPLWELIPLISKAYPKNTISHSLGDLDEILKSLKDGKFDLAILPFKLKDYRCVKFYDESLFISVKKDDPLAKKESVKFSDIDGRNFLLRSNLGFWDKLCRDYMPRSKFLVQEDEFDFRELDKNSKLARFVTDKSKDFEETKKHRINIPLDDKKARAAFYLIYLNEKIKELTA